MNKRLIIILIILIVAIVGIWLAYKNPQPAAVSFSSESSAVVDAPEQNISPTSYDIQGMKVEILQQGSGEVAKAGDTVTVNYVGNLQNGTKFDSSIDRGQTFQLTLGQNSVIKGWELGVTGMKVGEKRRLTIPPELAYGAQGAGGVIPPNATIIFEIDLLGINEENK